MNLVRIRTHWRVVVGLLANVTLVVACGGGVDSGGTGSYAVGPITGYGSIVIGGVHYDESEAVILDDDGASRTPDDLKLGMVAEVLASAPSGPASAPRAQAMAVRYASELLGPVTRVDAATGTLAVMGQAVVVEPTTVFAPTLAGGLAALKVDDIVEVYGQLDGRAGRYVATRIDARGAGVAAFKLRGLVTGWDALTRTLLIGGQTIDYAQVTDMPRLVAGSSLLHLRLLPDLRRRPWVATRAVAGARMVPDREVVEVEGRVTAFESIRSFEVDGVAVRTDDTTRFPGGTTGIALGARVEVDGSARDNVVTARVVSMDDGTGAGTAPFGFSGTISSSRPDLSTFEMRGFTIHYSDSTVFDSSSRADVKDGRRAEVTGSLSADGTRLEATKIHVERGS